MEVTRATVGDWERARAIRLAALTDAPDSFSATLDVERARPPEFWRERLSNDDAVTLLARADERDLGTLVLSAPADAPDAWIFAVWVDPEARGRGVGDALIEEAVRRARALRRARVRLDVGDHNARAQDLYARHGFRATGTRFALDPPRDHIHEHELALRLWPYPDVIAHRGAGTLAPENTLEALALAASLGQRMVEVDVKLSAEGVAVLLHDDSVARTTDGRGAVASMDLASIRALDAGAWHSERYRGARVPTLDEVADALRANGMHANLELKPCPGREAETGEVVAARVLALWRDMSDLPLLSSFSPRALASARAVAPGVPRALLTERLDEAALDSALALGCAAVHVAHAALDATTVARAHAVGLRVLAWTPNRGDRIASLCAAGVDGVITDAVDLVAPSTN